MQYAVANFLWLWFDFVDCDVHLNFQINHGFHFKLPNLQNDFFTLENITSASFRN